MGDPARELTTIPRRPVDGLPEPSHSDQLRRIRRMRSVARILDTAFRIPGTKVQFGADSLVGLIPGIGDLASGAVSAYLIVEAAKLGVPRHVLLRMLANIGIDAAVGSVPLLGDVFDVAFKANRRNMALVERYLRKHP